MKAVAVFFLAICLGGCATDDSFSGPTAADDPSMECFSSLGRDLRFDALYTKIPRAPNEATLAQLSSKEVPNEQEQKALEEWVSFRLHCLKSGSSYRAAYAPAGYDSVFTWLQIEVANTAAKLYAGEISFGQFNQKRAALGLEYGTRMDAVIANSGSSASQPRQLDSVSQQLLIDQARRAFAPGPSIGPATNCTSRNIGGTVYTDCR